MKMNSCKTILRTLRSLSFVLLASSVVFVSCKKEDNPVTVPPSNTIVDVAGSNSNLTLLTAAVTRAGLGTTLAGTGPFTVFAPSDAAFKAAGFADAAAINAAPVGTLSNILLYHVVSGTAVASSAIASGQTAVPTSVSGNTPIFTNKTASGVSVNNARVTTADVQASNGIVHVIDAVLMPPTGNVLQVVQADTTLSLLTAAAIRGGAAVTSALGGSTPITVFAPTNAAFRLTPFNSVSAINAADPTALAAILTNHVLAPARAYSPTLVTGPVMTFGGGSVTVTVGSNNAVTLLSKGNGTAAATVTKADLNATNGVIHKIDKVLLP